MEIITRKITEEEIEVYINLLMSKIDSWHYFAGPCLSSNKEWYDEDAAPQIVDELKCLYADNSNFKLLQSKLVELGLIPDDIIIVIDNGISSTLPIYTSIETICYEETGSVLAKAFFGNETHLLNNYGEILYENYYDELELGIGNLLMIRINEYYDTQFEHRFPNYPYEIFNYSSQFLKDRKIEFKTEPNTKYYIIAHPGYYRKDEIIGNGDVFVFENLPLGKYSVKKYLESEDDSSPFGGNKTETVLEKSIGETSQNFKDFTYNYEIFPSTNNYEKYRLKLLEIYNSSHHKEEVIKELLAFSSDSKDLFSIFPYLTDNLRMDIDILLALFIRLLYCDNYMFWDKYTRERNKTEILQPLPLNLSEIILLIENNDKRLNDIKRNFPIVIPYEHEKYVGENKRNTIVSFIKQNISRIKEVLFLFPQILQYANLNTLTESEMLLLGDNEQTMLFAADEDDDVLKIASDRLKNNREFIEKMILINGSHINKSGIFKTDRELVKAALLSEEPTYKLDKDILNLFSSDREIMTLYVNQNQYNIKDVSDELLADKEFLSSLIGEDLHVSHLYYSQSEKSIFKEYLKDKDLVKRLLCNYPGNIDKVDESFKSDRDIMIAIISKKDYGNYIKYGNDQVKNDKEILELSVSDSVYNIKYAGEIILKDTDFLIEIIKKYPDCFNHLPEEVQKVVERKMAELGMQYELIIKKQVEELEIKNNEKKILSGNIKKLMQQIENDLKNSSNLDNNMKEEDNDSLPF